MQKTNRRRQAPEQGTLASERTLWEGKPGCAGPWGTGSGRAGAVSVLSLVTWHCNWRIMGAQ